MQKALLLALIFGAFLFSVQSKAQESEPDPYVPSPLDCELGETWLEAEKACAIVAPESSCKLKTIWPNRDQWGYGSPYAYSSYQSVLKKVRTSDYVNDGPYYCRYNDTRIHGTSQVTTLDLDTSCSIDSGLTKVVTGTIITTTERVSSTGPSNGALVCEISDIEPDIKTKSVEFELLFELSDEIECPSEYPFGPSSAAPPNDLNQWCYRIPEKVCDTETGECEEEPPCEKDAFGNCIVPPDECFLTGSGSEVCYADPNEKCDVSIVNDEPVFSNCEAGCGFVGENLDNFICADEPELPSLDDCLVTTNGYACPSDTPEPNDDITDPEKPNADMKKSDFKDVLIGVETRLDGVNSLIRDQIARDADNTNKLSNKISESNAELKKIEDNTGSTSKTLRDSLIGDSLDADGDAWNDIKAALGLTGEETIEDLTVDEITLDEFKSEFNWSIGSAQCPAPRQITVIGKSFSMEWQPFCDAFNILSYLILAAAYFFSIMIAFGGKN